MTVDQLIGLVGVIATILIGGTVYKINKKKKNSGIKQTSGKNQIALQKSKQNNINIGGDISKDEGKNRSK